MNRTSSPLSPIIGEKNLHHNIMLADLGQPGVLSALLGTTPAVYRESITD
jgi:hypothetical protein